MEDNQPRVGVGLLIFKEGKVLLGKRKNAHGEGEFGGPGGHLEFGETIEECALRETKEERGIEVDSLEILTLTTLLNSPGKQYVDIGVKATWKTGEPQLLEPNKCESWGWYSPEEPPGRLFPSTVQYLEAIKTGRFYSGTIR